MSEIYEYKIHDFLRKSGGSASKEEIYKAFGGSVEAKRMIDEKLRMMERFGLITIEKDEVKLK
ncbi:hypothetical protein DRO64_03150 [Candidatus Bathyarchaeota archaeon]|nr:MAG: hypothetical protein DRO64_03150 [Candidatus Bathyarchaeota archaeon]HDM89381.1 hypothetical protein [Candidatus Bathyarchaeota archaeon]